MIIIGFFVNSTTTRAHRANLLALKILFKLEVIRLQAQQVENLERNRKKERKKSGGFVAARSSCFAQKSIIITIIIKNLC